MSETEQQERIEKLEASVGALMPLVALSETVSRILGMIGTVKPKSERDTTPLPFPASPHVPPDICPACNRPL